MIVINILFTWYNTYTELNFNYSLITMYKHVIRVDV